MKSRRVVDCVCYNLIVSKREGNKKIITITDPMLVETGDKVYVKDCDFGFTVVDVDRSDDTLAPLSATVISKLL